jgi:P-type E1-E2 ATPase
VVIGNAAWMKDNSVALCKQTQALLLQQQQRGCSVLVVAVEGRALMLLAVADEVQPEAPLLVGHLQRQGLEVWMATGDGR